MEQVGEIPKINSLDPRLSNTNFQSFSVKIDKENTQDIIDKWLADRGKFNLNPYYPIQKPRCEITLNGAKHVLNNCLSIIAKLRKTQEELRNKVGTMTSSEWKQKSVDIGGLKDEFDKAFVVFEDNTVLKSLKGTVIKRKKKRINQKKLKKFRQEQLKIKKEKQIEIDKSIDQWLESKKDEVERAKMEERMKKDADCVLYEVTKKKSEARKQLSLISALVKLRTVRDNMATQRGEKLSLEDRKAFGHVTEKLIRMWENAYQNYCKEEQCLRLMLEDTASKDTRAALTGKQVHIADQWQNLLFGPEKTSNNSTFWALTSADRDLEAFIAIRKSWDTFLRPSGSAIPLGWVVPPDTPNDNWNQYLKN